MDHELLEPFLSAPEEAGIFLDFDGTLSEVVPVPAEARPVPGAADVLERLASRYRVVAVVSGRSAADLSAWLPGVEIWGTHGAERVHDGNVELSEEAAPWAETVRAAIDAARDRVASLGLDGVVVEDKRVVAGLHWRNASDRRRAEDELRELAGRLAAAHGLVVADSKMAVELRPPIELSKAGAVLARAREEGLRAAAFAGDDLVDLAAFDALDELARSGVATLRIAVDSDETPEAVLSRADIVVAGPAGAIALLEELASRARPRDRS